MTSASGRNGSSAPGAKNRRLSMNEPAVTVVIPAFNAAPFIGDALRSIREQTLKGVEVLVVDDASTDDTVREATRFAGEMDLTVLTQPNAGPAAARNRGIQRARSRYCAFLDADDVMLPERLQAQLEMLAAEPDLGLVHTDLMTFDDRGVIHRTRRAFSEPCGGMVLDKLLLNNFITTSTVMAPTACLKEVGMFGESRRVSEDFELWLRMAARWKVGFIDQPLVQYRRRPGSLSDDKVLSAQCALDVVKQFWLEHPEYRTKRPDVFRESLAAHLAAVGHAAVVRGNRATALSYLVQSLRLHPWKRRSWKSLAKAMVPMRPDLGRAARVGSAGI
jgi:cellulose synthase/poly-beta-1,6-N-acetylglucosamine synthase-like glycosyltransferase